jgi:citronellol/citronellal dehydrogenase
MKVLITGASRGIGAAVARSFAKRGAQIVLVARSNNDPVHGSLEGTLMETEREVRALGGLPIVMNCDVGDADAWKETLKGVNNSLDGVDVLINNASALYINKTSSVKEMDVLYRVNTRATMLAIQECLPYMNRNGGSIVTLSPPIRMGRLEWLSMHPSYTVSKYSMSMATLAAASNNVRANCLWPKRMVATAATKRIEEFVPGAYTNGRSPDEVSESIYKLAVEMDCNAECVLDEDVMDMSSYDAPMDAFVEDAHAVHSFSC